MKKKVRLSFVIIILAIILGWLALMEGSHRLRSRNTETIRSRSGYDFAVKALKQFPFPYQLESNWRLGTLVGIGPCNESKTKLYLKVVTREDELIYIEVSSGDGSDLTAYQRKLWPGHNDDDEFWDSVILFEKKAAFRDYITREIKMVGRFLIQWDSGGPNPNLVLGYRNESYL